MKNNYNKTLLACFLGYIIQAIVNNFVPLLFLMFHNNYNIPLSKITLLITINFGLQLVVDLISAGFIDKIGYRACAIIAHICAALGFIMLTILPDVLSDPFIGLLISVIIYAIGGGLLEVLVSPIAQSCPTKHKEKAMSLLHSFYCWGHVGVVLISTVFFKFAGLNNWKYLTYIWAILPIANIILFATAPINTLNENEESKLSIKELLSMKLFWIFAIMMLCAGASEQSISQWASTFAESGLHVSKTVGDIAGPMSFAALMGVSRTFYGKYGDRIDLDKFMIFSSILCIVSYFIISLVPNPVTGLIGCSICGLSVGIMWPGTFSKAAAQINGGSTAMFAFFALAGDLGCTSGPTLVGYISNRFNDNFKIGILAAAIFPLFLLSSILLSRKIPGK